MQDTTTGERARERDSLHREKDGSMTFTTFKFDMQIRTTMCMEEEEEEGEKKKVMTLDERKWFPGDTFSEYLSSRVEKKKFWYFFPSWDVNHKS